ncbi:hypothetical protein [Tardiphaga sp. vice278]|uniref:hypothetical protein n=1 Tax=Tardiphaga sp. vice278 TaxID=2592815 RepID=UPI001161D2A2|nr:hypothetical protein [Tardiphaga sp. vice278]QDM17950.1 hypothetical protein FNL53_19860 [Tardiphaga sp. vice278]
MQPISQKPDAYPPQRVNATWLWALAAIAVFQLVRAHASPSPIYAGDEYAYFANGIFRSRIAELWQRDPYLQRLASPLFIAVIDWCARLFPAPAVAVRTLDVSAYLAMISLAGWCVFRTAGNRHAVAMVVLAGLLPSSGYAVAVMPELPFYAAVVMAVLTLAGTSTSRPIGGAALAAGFTAVAFLLKPHAISLLLGAVCARVLLVGILIATKRPWRMTVASTAAYVFFTWLCLVASSIVLLRTLRLDPRFVLGDFYASAAQTSLSVIDVRSIISYFVGNAAGLLLYSLPLFGLMVLHAASMFRNKRSGTVFDLPFLNLFLTLVMVALASLMMVAMFTSATGALTPSEALRLHGRYYAYLLPLAAAASLGIPSWRQLLARPVFEVRWPWLDGYRLIGGLWLIAGALFLPIIWRFQILPWDNPELYPLFRNDLSVWVTTVNVGWFAVATPLVLASAALAMLLRSKIAPIAVIVALVLVFAMGTFNTTRFQYFQVASTQFMTDAGRFARDFFPRGADASVLLVGTETYGADAYVLFGMACNCHVLSFPTQTPLTKAQLPAGIRLIFAVRSYPVDFPTEVLFKAPAGSLHRVID